MAKLHMANTLHQAADVAIQLQGARGYSKDTIAEWVYRAARAARLVDGADEVHKMVLAKFMREEAATSGTGARGTGYRRRRGLCHLWYLAAMLALACYVAPGSAYPLNLRTGPPRPAAAACRHLTCRRRTDVPA